jgi:asparagine synthase (glutamine-hydrolysing)
MSSAVFDPLRLAPMPLDIASGWLFGTDEAVAPLPRVEHGFHPTTALEEIVLPAVAAPPCLVSFSGGRDSSAVLAVATAVARREGLPLPVPVTLEPRGVPAMDERRWQELVLSHLQIVDSQRIVVDDELDLVGPVAQRVLRRHGLLFPPTFTVLAVILAEVKGRSLLTGISGDSYLGGWRYGELSAGLRGKPTGRSAVAAGYAALPGAVRARYLRRLAPVLPWLRPATQRRVIERWSVEEAGEPVGWNQFIVWRTRLRRMLAMTYMSRLVGEDAGIPVISPLEHPRFLSALAAAGGRRGLGGRTAIMRTLFAGRLPEAVIARTDKARITPAVFREPARDLARTWQGEGSDDTLVDPGALRATWLAPDPDLRSGLQLQAAWLASQGRSGRGASPPGMVPPSDEREVDG